MRVRMGVKLSVACYMLICTLFLLSTFGLVIYWIDTYRGGYAGKENPSREFNWHPTLMIGFISSAEFSLLCYGMVVCCPPIFPNALHIIFNVIGVACASLGFLFVWDSVEQSGSGLPHFYSLHSWLGIVTLAAFTIQVGVGLLSFLVSLCSSNSAKWIAPTYTAMGLATMSLAAATAASGLTEKAIFELGQNYTLENEEALIINSIGVGVFGSLIFLMLAIRAGNNAMINEDEEDE